MVGPRLLLLVVLISSVCTVYGVRLRQLVCCGYLIARRVVAVESHERQFNSMLLHLYHDSSRQPQGLILGSTLAIPNRVIPDLVLVTLTTPLALILGMVRMEAMTRTARVLWTLLQQRRRRQLLQALLY